MNGPLPILVVLNLAALAVGWSVRGMGEPVTAAYPQRPIELVVPFSHGGSTDTFARIIERAIREHDLLPQPLTIINRGGAGGTIGSRFVKDAEPDGYTLMILHDAIITAKYAGMVEYGPEAFEVVAGTGELGMVIAVSEDSSFKTFDELLLAAQAAPSTIRFGANFGALAHFAGLQLERAKPGAQFRFPQVGGGAERFGDLIGGHIDVTGFSIEEFQRFAPSGLRGLAYLGPRRHPAAPDIPTARELGHDIVSTNMFFWWFPQQTPPQTIETIREALQLAMQTDDVRAKLAEMQMEPEFLIGDALESRLVEADERFANVVTRPMSVMVRLPWLLLIASAGLIVVIGLQSRWASANVESADDSLVGDVPDAFDEMSTKERNRAALCLLVTGFYVAALAGGIGFALATIVFVPAIGSILVPNARATQVMTLLLLGQTLGFGLDIVFTRLFEVSLP